MLVTLIKKESISTITLPEKISGQYWLKDTDESGKSYPIISIEGINGQWYLKSNKNAFIVDSYNSTIKNNLLVPLSFCAVMIKDAGQKAFVYTEPITTDRQKFKKLVVTRDISIEIGRAENNTVVFDNRFVSSYHARLVFSNGKWAITDLESTNGTFVNGYRISTQTLAPGDAIYIMGLKIIVGSGFIAINNPDRLVSFKSDILLPFTRQSIVAADEDADENIQDYTDYFYRSPRFKRGIEKQKYIIDPPPQNAIGDEMPIIFLLGPSITMGMASMASGVFAVGNAVSNGNMASAMPSVVMSSSMLLGTVLWPIISKKYEKKKQKKKEALRQKKYKEYIEKMSAKFNEEYYKQKTILLENYIHITECIKRIEGIERNLWERGLGQDDFLKLRVGLGSTLLEADIEYSKRKFTLTEDNLTEMMYNLCESPKLIDDIPITLSLFDDYISGVIGNKSITREFAKGLIFQLASLYSYDEIKMVFVYDLMEEKDFKFAKWLPHVWSDDKKIRFVATNTNELKEVSAYLEEEIKVRADISETEIQDKIPYYIIFAFSNELSVHAEMLKQIYSKKKNINMSIVTFFDELKNLPKECTAVVELENESGKIYDRNDISGQFTPFTPDIFIKSDTVALGTKLANVQLDTMQKSQMLPTMLTFLEMFGVGKVEHLNSLTRWKENNPSKTLEAAVGVDIYGDILKLDLHEKFHGPHGLIAGMTGSGKSEFIISYILSLAVNYHPNEVAFILIDYKGGGMAKAFEELPHTMGIITNLDGAAVKRSLISIESELKRRQGIFAEVSKSSGVSNIDIYKYQKMFREGKVSEPLQHLFIISDEFAELKTQQPEFMAQLISAARIGRSLGVHLILATQKPSGVVDDQIWSNSKFRVCLKVQERSDSMDMLKRQDAAELSNTGRFYLQVGYNELFEMGQSAWAGAPYYPSEKVIIEKDNSISVIDINGRPIRQMKMDNKFNFIANPSKQLDAITDYLNSIAKEENIKIRPLWLEPIPEVIVLDSIRKKYGITDNEDFELHPVIGEYDDPARQQQCILRLPISREGNVVVYGSAGNGKTTFLTTMIYSLMQEHSPDDVNIYILDFASETLKAFSKAPHVGEVILSYEGEKISNLFKFLLSETERRKKLFSESGGDFNSYRSSTGQKIPSIVIAINNFAAFTEIFEEKEEAVSYLSREGTKYGIFFVLTATGTGAVRFRLLQNFKLLMALQLNDEMDYSTVLGKTNGVLPSRYKGRGLMKTDEIYEFQVAYITDEKNSLGFIQNKCSELKENWKGKAAKKIPILPEYVDLDFITNYISNDKSNQLPVGVDKNSLEVYYYPFGSAYINMILSAGNDHINFVNALSQLMANKCMLDVTVFDPQQLYLEKDTSLFKYYSLEKECETAVTELFDQVVYRHNTTKDAAEKGEQIEAFQQKVIVINSVSALKNVLSEQGIERLGLILERGESRYNITVIISENVKNLSSLSFEKWFKKHVSQSDGIWVGNGITDQYQLKPSKMTSEMRDDISEEFGFALRNGKSNKLKLLIIRKEEE